MFQKIILTLFAALLSLTANADQLLSFNCPLPEHKNDHAFMRAEINGVVRISTNEKIGGGTLNMKLVERGNEQKTTYINDVSFEDSALMLTENFVVAKVLEKEICQLTQDGCVDLAPANKIQQMMLMIQPEGLTRLTTWVKMKDGRFFKTKCSATEAE